MLLLLGIINLEPPAGPSSLPGSNTPSPCPISPPWKSQSQHSSRNAAPLEVLWFPAGAV